MFRRSLAVTLLLVVPAGIAGLPSTPISLGTYTPTPAGYVNTKYQDGNDGSVSIPLLWASIPDQTTPSGAGYSVNLCSYLTQPGTPNATISVTPGYALPNADWSLGGTDDCTLTFATPYTAGTATVRFRATRDVATSDTPELLVGGIAGSNPAVAPVISAVTSTGTTTPATSLRITWGAVTNAHHYLCRVKWSAGTGPTDWYYVTGSGTFSQSLSSAVACGSGTSTITYDMLNLSSGVLQDVQVAAVNSAGTVVLWSATSTGTPTSGGGSSSAKKWNPGYYMQYGREKPTGYWNQWANRKAIYDDSSFASNSNVVGVAWTFPWSMLEGATQGDYSAGFALIDNEVAYLKSLPSPKRFILKIVDYAWDTPCPSVMVPAYVSSNGWVMNMPSGSVPLCKVMHWNADVQTAFNALIAAYGARYDSEPYFEGFVPHEETSVAIPAGSGGSAAAVMVQNKRMVDALVAAWPTTNVLLAVNWVADGLADTAELMAYMASKGVGQLSVDTCRIGDAWCNDGIWGDQVFLGVYGGVDYRGVIPSWAGAEASELGYDTVGPPGGYTATEVATWANDTLKASHMLWDYNEFIGDSDQRWSTGLLPYINANPTPTYTSCPTAYTAGCTP